jgi:hypothetical protein
MQLCGWTTELPLVLARLNRSNFLAQFTGAGVLSFRKEIGGVAISWGANKLPRAARNGLCRKESEGR